MAEFPTFNIPQETPKRGSETGLFDVTRLFFQSAIESAGPGMLGFDPSAAVEEFREEHPFGGFTSQMLGIGVPLVLAPELAFLRFPQALRALPLAGKLLRGATTAKRAGKPIKALALREAGILLPFELGRVGLTAAINPSKTGEVAQAAAFDLVTIPIAYGAFAGLRQAISLPSRVAGFEQRVSRAFPGFETNIPIQRRLDNITKFLSEVDSGARAPSRGTVEAGRQDLLQLRNQLKELVVREVPGNINGLTKDLQFAANERGVRFIGRLARTTDSVSNSINSFFKTSKRKGFTTEKIFLDRSGKLGGISDPTRLEDVIKNLPENFESSMQFPRLLTATTEQGAETLNRVLDQGLDLKRGTFRWRRERDGGAYVIAVKRSGDVNASAIGDEYLLFKTDRLGLYSPPGMRDAEKQLSARVFDQIIETRRAEKLSANSYTRLVENEMQVLERTPIMGTPTQRSGAVQLFLRNSMSKELRQGLATVRAELGAVAGDVDQWLRKFAYPSLVQFSNNVQAARALGTVRLVFGKSTARASAFLDGVPKVDLKGSHADIFFGSGPREGGIVPLIRAEETSLELDLAPAMRIVTEGKTLEEAASEGLSAKAMEFLGMLSRKAGADGQEMGDLAGLSTRSRFTPRQDHLLLSNTWMGVFRVRLIDSQGRLKAIASGQSKANTIQEANDIIEAVKVETGETLTKALARQRAQEPGFQTAISDRDSLFAVGDDGLDDIELVKMLQTGTRLSKAVASGRVRSLERTPFFARPRGGVKGATVPMTKRDIEQALRRAVVGREKFKAQLALMASPRFQKLLSEIQENNPETFKQLESRIDDFMGIKGPVVKTVENIIDAPLRAVGVVGATRIMTNLNRAMFSLTLGFGDLGYVALNGMQFIQTAMPEMAFILTAAPEVVQKYYAWGMVPGMGGMRRVAGTLDMLKILNSSFREMINPSPELAAVHRRAILDGTKTPRFVEEFSKRSDLALKIKEVFRGDQPLSELILRASEFLPAKSESFSRSHALTMGFIIGRDFLGATGDDLYRIAQDFTNRTMFLYSQADRPRIMAGAVGGMLGLFKNWTVHYMANMGLYAGEASRGNWKPLLWMMAGTGTVAGIGGLPLYGVADATSRMLTDTRLVDHLYAGFGTEDDTTIADAAFYGLPALAGVSLSSRGAAPGADFGRDVGFLFSFALMDRMRAGGRMLQTASEFFDTTGQHPMNSDRFRLQLARFALPRTMYRALGLAEDFGVRSMRSGNLLIEEQSVAEAAAFVAGITPVRTEKLLDAHRQAFDDQEKMRVTVSTMGRALAEAELNADGDRVGQIFRQAARFGIIDRVMPSAKIWIRNLSEPLSVRQFPEFQEAARRRLLGLDR